LAVFYLVGFGVHRMLYGRDAMTLEMRSWWAGVVTIGIVGFLAFVVLLVVTPFQMFDAQRVAAKQANDTLDSLPKTPALPAPAAPPALSSVEATEPIWLRERVESLGEEKKALLARLDDRAKLRSIREQIAKSIADGEAIKRECISRKDGAPPTDEANKWARDVEEYLGKALDPSSVGRFRKANLPISPNAEMPEPYKRLWNAINQRILNLNEITTDVK
jgi:hypothetical protein